jgi:hypothetical protein
MPPSISLGGLAFDGASCAINLDSPECHQTGVGFTRKSAPAMQMGDTRPMNRMAFTLFLLLTGCAMPPPRPELAACFARMERHAASLMPAFAVLGFRPEVHLRLDEDMVDGSGFRKSANTLGDALPSGSIRLRPSRLCSDDVLGRAVVAHEMSHVALQHRGVAGSGITLLWEQPPRQEVAANELAYAALKLVSGDDRAAIMVSCWLGKCDTVAVPGENSRSW